jgi:catechol 2,3-dioxygenase-like lactoylglutathione lyase family enzyme
MKLTRLSPILWTKNLKETIDFYENVLDFKSSSSFPNFVYLSREDVALMFVVPEGEPEDCKDADNPESFFPRPLLTGSIYIYIDQVDELWNSIKDKTRIKSSLEDREYLMRDFSILDNNGYEIVFGEDISSKKI